MSRGKSGTKSKIIKTKSLQAMNAAMKEFTRRKAEKSINAENCREKRFANHRNYHVRMKAWVLQGCPKGETDAERKDIIENLTKGRSKEACEKIEAMFNPPAQVGESEGAEEAAQ